MPEDSEDTQTKFPKDFLWGASTAAHQVEGGNHNQWSEWEKANAERLASEAEATVKTLGKRLQWNPEWHKIQKQAEDPANYISGDAVDHYHKYKEDFDILGQLNFNAFRFSVEWSRIEPVEGQWNQVAIDHYRTYIAELKKRKIEPVLNIWHWTVPVWFEEKGGFAKRANLKFFERFVEKIGSEVARDVKYIIILNEPNVYAAFSYALGQWPPQKTNLLAMGRVYWNLMLTHRSGYKLLKKQNPGLQIGVAAQLDNIQAKNPHAILDVLSTKAMRYLWNWWFLFRVRKFQDFVGINYYFTDYYNGFFKKKNPNLPLSDVGWYMEPEGLYPLLLRAWKHFKKPIIVTENGVADAEDEYRRWWIEETIVAMERAMSEGVQIKGYLHWSLLDNFEWALGWWPKFGLVKVDRHHNMKREVRDSAKWFAEFIAKQRK